VRKISAYFCLILLFFGFAGTSNAAPKLYTFEGFVSGFQSYHQNYDIDDFGIIIGGTTLRYVFEVDFNNGVSTYTNSAGTWNYFYSDLIEGSVINGGLLYGDYYGFNWYRLSGPNMGEITSNHANVRIDSYENDTQNWRVQDWQIGQAFSSTDLASYPGGINGSAVYAYGDVTLTSITAIPIPGAVWLLGSGLIGLVGLRKKFRKA